MATQCDKEELHKAGAGSQGAAKKAKLSETHKLSYGNEVRARTSAPCALLPPRIPSKTQ